MASCVCKYVTRESQDDGLPTQFEHFCCENEVHLVLKNSGDNHACKHWV